MKSIIRQIEEALGGKVALHQAPTKPCLLDGVMAYRENQPKYAFDEQGRLIGLNLASTGLDDNSWKRIVALFEEQQIRLQALNLCDNRLKSFTSPPFIAEMIVLDLDDNPLEYPPPETVDKGQDAILRFLQVAATQGTRDAFEVKMLIVGEGDTGKTTLWNLLQNPDHPVPDEDQKSTVGIQVEEGWSFDHLDRPGDTFFVNLWDFGGQEIQYMTHQFFLTRRSFYVLLADARREAANFPYWLDIINLLGRDQTDQGKLPVLVVLNEKGNRNPAPPYDPATIAEQYPELEISKREVDFAVKDGRMEVVTRAIQEILCHRIGHLPIKIPLLWDEVRNRIKILQKSENQNHINHQQFTEICASCGVKNRRQQDDLSQLFHDLGIILHFREPTLEDFIVLNPDWAVNAVYAILKNDDVQDINQGRFNKVLLKDIWTDNGFSVAEQDKLLNLMLKDGLEVCFRAMENNEELFIAPQLLPEEPPEGIAWIDSPTILRYVYHYPFMPKGIVGRLIVRLHEDIEQCEEAGCVNSNWRKMVWKNGVYLKKDKCRARMRYSRDREQGREIIKIEVQGDAADDRKYVLREIRQQLDLIHRCSFPSLKFFQKIPCNCEECGKSLEPYEHDYDVLLERMKQKVAAAECQKSFQMVPVQQLLDGITVETSASVDKPIGISVSEVEETINNNSPHSSDTEKGPQKQKHWYQQWWAWVAGAVTLLAGIAGFTGYTLSDIWQWFNKQ